jgi:hypothetical protein
MKGPNSSLAGAMPRHGFVVEPTKAEGFKIMRPQAAAAQTAGLMQFAAIPEGQFVRAAWRHNDSDSGNPGNSAHQNSRTTVKPLLLTERPRRMPALGA